MQRAEPSTNRGGGSEVKEFLLSFSSLTKEEKGPGVSFQIVSKFYTNTRI